ncbi:hypothetical protein GCM10010174_73770 [Kutzneria viridogrisea]|uniref:YcaO domain-containing protein n=2 Tax=Kutzneria TaxID=43356 RepID=W5WFL7_9PSEU|nr:YcaO-like family protein [Kutzneria albida]AHH96964.1 hypothetical protein KALB_3600 [Kutzneria albida DSM 43870]MBA8932071.1 hypothetical protein [Kutzneria viridogrisea]
MRPMLRPDAYFASLPEGAFWLTHDGPVLLSGDSIAQWVRRLAPHLDGENSLTDLLAGLSADRAEFVGGLVRTLLDRGVAREAPPTQLPPARLLAPFAAEVGFVDYYRDFAVSWFQRYRGTRTLVIGAGRSLAAAVNAALRSGLSRVTVAITDECPTDLSELESTAPTPTQGLAVLRNEHILSGEPDYRRLMHLLDGVRLVMQVSDRYVPTRADALARACVDSGALLVQAFVDGDGAWVGPLPLSGGTDRGAVWRRVLGPRAAGGEGPERPGSLATATMAAHLVHRVFCELTGATSLTDPAQRSVTRLDFSGPASSSHRVVPHPFGRPARALGIAEFHQMISVLATREPLSEEEFSVRAAKVVDGRVGPLLRLGERDFSQLPLNVCEAVLADPLGLVQGEEVSVTAAGHDFSTARHRAALRAFAAYSSMVVDPRLLYTDGGAGDGSDPDEGLARLVEGGHRGWLWGVSLVDGRPRQVEVRSVFPVLDTGSAQDVVYSGAAAGYSWQEAVLASLVGRCRELTLAALDRAVPLALDRCELDARGTHYLRLVAAAGRSLTVHDVTGELGVPTLVLSLDGTAVCCASALRFADALHEGLESALLACQAEIHRQPEYAPPKVDPLPLALVGAEPVGPRPDVDLATAVSALRRKGFTPVAVPLDHDPEMSGILPHVAQVVLLDD